METSVWTNIELLGGGTPAIKAEQVEIEWPRISYMQRLLIWLRSRFSRIVGVKSAPVDITEKQPDFGSVAQEYLCDTHEVTVPHI